MVKTTKTKKTVKQASNRVSSKTKKNTLQHDKPVDFYIML